MIDIGRMQLYARTLRYLRPSQAVHRARLRGQRSLLARYPDRLERRWTIVDGSQAPGWPASFIPLDSLVPLAPDDVARLEQREFTFLSLCHQLGDPADWEDRSLPQLWRYHLHYMEWAWSLWGLLDTSAGQTVFSDLYRSWAESTTYGRWDAWSPYVVSLRLWVWCGVFDRLVRGTDLEAALRADIARHVGYLRANTEHDVGGNHLVKNLKGLTGGAVFLGDHRELQSVLRQIAKQCAVQVLADGGHYERSPSYHCQVLGDLIDIVGLCAAAGVSIPGDIEDSIERMRAWLGSMLMPDGDVPLFNDCTLVGKDRIAALAPVAAATRRLTVLRESGYVVVRPKPGDQIVVDVGPPCPDDLPAHAHADCLSFELAVGGRRSVVDTGTSTYDPGERRRYERSTAAHNTLTVDGQDQTEVWGTFRAARRARPTLERVDDSGEQVTITASHDGYRRLAGRPIHRRTLTVADGRMDIVDEVTGRGTHLLELACHLSGEAKVQVELAGLPADPQPAEHAQDFGQLRRERVVRMATTVVLPTEVRWSVRFDRADAVVDGKS